MGSSETWLCNVKVTIHSENDGPRCLRRGLEPIDREVTLEEAVRNFGEKYVRRHILECLDLAIIRVNETGGARSVWS